MRRSVHRQIHRVLPVSLALLLATGCGNQDENGDGPYDELRILPGHFAEEPITKPLVAVEAFIGADEFFVSYESEGGLVYSGGNWSNRVDLAALKPDQRDGYTGPFILPLEYVQRNRWPELPTTPVVPRLLSSKYWNRFIDEVFESVLPEADMTGIVMKLGEEDYFLFYNKANKFEARLIIDKPKDYVVAEAIDFAEFIERARPVMEAFLTQEGIEERRLLFSTGDAGAYSLPFVFIDRDLPVAMFLRYSPAPMEGPIASKASQRAQTASHVVKSHLGGVLSRPVTSMHRLFFVAKDVAVEAVTPSWLGALESEPIPELRVGPGMDLDAWEAQVDDITGRSATRGTIEYLVDGEEFFIRFIDAVTTAGESVDIRTYIFDNDDFAMRIGDLLRRRSNEDVDVRVLLDGIGTIAATGVHDVTQPEEYQAPKSVRAYLEKDSKIDVRLSINPWIVAGDHVKTTIVDDDVAFAGGMNIGREYRYVWHDLMVELRGAVVERISNEFNKAWAHAGLMGDVAYLFSRLKRVRRASDDVGYPLRLLHTRPGDPEIYRVQRAAIRNAKKYIYIENAYFTDDAMLYELVKARRRGVDVRVILPLVGNHGPINKSNALAANAMLENGIRVFLYPGMSHVKAAVFDGWACLGSANWDKLSFKTNKELNVATSHPEYVEGLLDRVFTPDFEHSVELLEPFPARWSDHLMEVVADYVG
ncbi:MAG: phosphatidylserine/phosphatidylglycerophosphate/cardiolipin synthase family protein [Betaproteobacteria bacterium]|nr:MAG: phosphatidylserine/phosphatidylglycerophosphate/cardiolipin synthase family protein [Betaproteobacteria bacterium]